MGTKIKINVYEMIFHMVLFAFSISLFNMAGYIFAAMCILVLFFSIKSVTFSMAEVHLILFSVSYFLFYLVNYGIGLESIIQYLLGPFCAYLIGKLYLMKSKENKAFIKLIFTLGIGMFLHGVLNWYAYINSSYVKSYENYRLSIDFWRGTIVNVNSTGIYFVLLTGITIGIIFAEYKKVYKFIAALALILSIAITVFFANRALLYIVFILMSLQFVRYIGNKNNSNRKKIILLSVVGLSIIVIICIVVGNVFNIQEYLLSLKLVQRIQAGETSSRWVVWYTIFEDFNFLKYPFGGGHIVSNSLFNYLHNMWLDVYNMVGIFPFIMLVVVTITLIKRSLSFRIILINSAKEEEWIIYSCLMLSVFLNCMVEPIIESNPYYFLMIIMVFGAMEGEKIVLKRIEGIK